MSKVLWSEDLLMVGIDSVTLYETDQYRKGMYAGIYEVEYTDGVVQWGDDEEAYKKYIKMYNQSKSEVK